MSWKCQQLNVRLIGIIWISFLLIIESSKQIRRGNVLNYFQVVIFGRHDGTTNKDYCKNTKTSSASSNFLVLLFSSQVSNSKHCSSQTKCGFCFSISIKFIKIFIGLQHNLLAWKMLVVNSKTIDLIIVETKWIIGQYFNTFSFINNN